MFQPDEENGIRNAIILWAFLFVIIYIFLSMTSCATGSETPKVACPSPEFENYKPELLGEFIEHSEYAKEGCKRHYGPRACLIKLKRKGFRDYHATCKVMPDAISINYSL